MMSCGAQGGYSGSWHSSEMYRNNNLCVQHLCLPTCIYIYILLLHRPYIHCVVYCLSGGIYTENRNPLLVSSRRLDHVNHHPLTALSKSIGTKLEQQQTTGTHEAYSSSGSSSTRWNGFNFLWLLSTRIIHITKRAEMYMSQIDRTDIFADQNRTPTDSRASEQTEIVSLRSDLPRRLLRFERRLSGKRLRSYQSVAVNITNFINPFNISTPIHKMTEAGHIGVELTFRIDQSSGSG